MKLFPIMNPAEPAIRITIDDRELRGPVPGALKAHGRFDVAAKRLAVGDYCVDETLLFERKTLRDLAVSIIDGRLFDQALRLAKVPQNAALILEGRGTELAATGIRREAIQGALLNVSLFIGLPVLRTQDAIKTARTMAYAARQQRASVCGALPRRGYRPKGKAALQSYILQGLPGIGPERAARLLHRFGTVEAAMSARPDALAEVDGIGTGIARKVRWAVEEEAGDYLPPGSAGVCAAPGDIETSSRRSVRRHEVEAYWDIPRIRKGAWQRAGNPWRAVPALRKSVTAGGRCPPCGCSR